MDEQIESMVISVRADTAAFARDVSSMRGELEGPLASGVGRAGRLIDSALSRAIINGKAGFGDLKKVALAAMADIASASLRALLQPSGGGSLGTGILGGLSSLISGLVGSPGRATGGPVTGGRPYMVGERGPELFVPSASGRIETLSGGGTRDLRVAISVNAPASANEPQALRQSSRQIARAVRSALRKGGA